MPTNEEILNKLNEIEEKVDRIMNGMVVLAIGIGISTLLILNHLP